MSSTSADQCSIHKVPLTMFLNVGTLATVNDPRLKRFMPLVQEYWTTINKCDVLFKNSVFKKFYTAHKNKVVGENLAVVKIFNFLISNRLFPNGPIIDIGAAPGFVTEKFANCDVPVTSFTSLDAAEKHLTRSQLNRYFQVIANKNVAFIDGNVFCLECLTELKDKSPNARYIVCDVGWPITYNENKYCRLDFIAPARNVISVFGESASLIFCKIQNFTMHLDFEFITKLLELPKAVFFVKPIGSWNGNHEIYVLITDAFKKNISHTLASLEIVLQQIICYRNFLIFTYSNNMGIKNILKILTPMSGALRLTNETVKVDFSCLAFIAGLSLIFESPIPFNEKKEGCFRSGNMEIEIMALIKCIIFRIEKIFNTCSNLKLDICFDGPRRPMMKNAEAQKRVKYLTPKQVFLKNLLHEEQSQIIAKFKDFDLSQTPCFAELKTTIAEAEADVIVCKGGEVSVTNDSDIILMSAIQQGSSYVVMCNVSEHCRIYDINDIRSDFDITSLYFYTLIAGNDYLPTLYSPVDTKKLYFNISKSVKTIKDIFVFLQQTKCVFKNDTNVNDCFVVLKEWIFAVTQFKEYLSSGDFTYLEYDLKNMYNIKNFTLKTILNVCEQIPETNEVLCC